MATTATPTTNTSSPPVIDPVVPTAATALAPVNVAQAEQLIHAGEASRALSVALAEQGLHLAAADHQVHVAEKTVSIGLQMSSGAFVDFSAKLSNDQKKELSDLLTKFGGNIPGFTIDLEELKDGNRNVLLPLPGQSKSEFTRDIKRLRELANLAIGTNLYFKRYPMGHRTCVEKQNSFAPGNSDRLKKLKFEKHHLEQRLDESSSDAEKKKILATHVAAKGLIDDSKLLLERMKGSRSIGYDLEGESRKKRIVGVEERAPSEAAVLYGATHLVDFTASPNIGDAQKQAAEFINSFSLAHSDREPGGFIGALGEGFISAATIGLLPLPFRFANDISEENKKQEDAFADQLVLLGAKSRSEYEFGRAVLRAEERSDGTELFFVQLADLVANAQSDQEIVSFMSGDSAELAFGHLHEIDKRVYRDFMTQAALEYRRVLSGIEVGVKPAGASLGVEYANASNNDNNRLIDAFDAAFARRKSNGSPAVQGQPPQASALPPPQASAP